MLSATEIARGSQGAVRFLQRDPGAPFHFDNTLEGCLRSFQVMLLVAPLYALYRLDRLLQTSTTAAEDVRDRRCVEALRYVVDWLLFPVIFYEIARRRGWLDRYPRYIAALNWINLPAMVLLLVVDMRWPSLVPPTAGGRCCSRPAGPVLLLVHDGDAAVARRQLAARGGADGRELGAVLLPVTSRQPLPRRRRFAAG